MDKDELFKNVSDFIFVVLITISLTRIWAISLFYIFGKNSEIIERIVNDPWHHYQLGIALIVFAYFLRRLKKFKFVSAIGVGIFLEEWPVFLSDLGLNTKHLYHTKLDFILIFVLTGLIYILSSFLAKSIPVAKIVD